MGIHGIIAFLASKVPQVIRPVPSMDIFGGKRVFIDCSIILRRNLHASTRTVMEHQKYLQARGGTSDSYIDVVAIKEQIMSNAIKPLITLNKTLKNVVKKGGIESTFVLGPLDENTLNQNKFTTDPSYINILDGNNKELLKNIKEYLSGNSTLKFYPSLSHKHISAISSLLTENFAKVQIRNPDIAKKCVEFCTGEEDCVLSDDTNVLAYGAPNVIRDYFGTKACTVINHGEMLKALNFTREQFMDLCILLGYKYNVRIPEIGPERAFYIITRFKSLDNFIKSPAYQNLFKSKKSVEMLSKHNMELGDFTQKYFNLELREELRSIFTHFVGCPDTDPCSQKEKHLISHVASIFPLSNKAGLSLEGEYGKHLASVVFKINIPSQKININPVLNIEFLSYFYKPFDLLELFIVLISNIQNSEPKCKCTCTCSCNSNSNKKSICICVCENTLLASSNGSCICICKNTNCTCVCICTNTQNCNTQHTCRSCLVKVDIGSLEDQASRVRNCLRWIRCFICKHKNQSSPSPKTCFCCTRSCCVNEIWKSSDCPHCYCKFDKTDYGSLIPRIHWMESSFEKISENIPQLILFNNTLLFYSTILTKSSNLTQNCCKGKIEKLIRYCGKALRYYYLFAYRIKDIKIFLGYKSFSPELKEILDSLQKSIKCFLHINIELIKKLVKLSYTTMFNSLMIIVYSRAFMFQCFFGLNVLIQSSTKVYKIMYIIGLADGCNCVIKFKSNNNTLFEMSVFYHDLLEQSKKNINELKNFPINDGNHLCICLVMKYVLYPSLIKSMDYLRHFYLGPLSSQKREFILNLFNRNQINELTKLIYLVIIIFNKISVWLENKYTKNIYCFCYNMDDPYYPYLVSIILYLSSLIQNVWSLDKHSMVTAIQSLSNLYSEVCRYDFSASNDIDKLETIKYLLNFKSIVKKSVNSYLSNYINFLSNNYNQCYESLQKNIETFKCIKSCVKSMLSELPKNSNGVGNGNDESTKLVKSVFSYISNESHIKSTIESIKENLFLKMIDKINGQLSKLNSTLKSKGIDETTSKLGDIKNDLDWLARYITYYFINIKVYLINPLSRLNKIESNISKITQISRKYDPIKHKVNSCKSSLELDVERLKSIKSDSEILEKNVELIIELLKKCNLYLEELKKFKEQLKQCQQRNCTCIDKKCKSCLCGKSIYLRFNIELEMTKLGLNSIIKHMMVDILRLGQMERFKFTRNSFINGNLETLIILAITKKLNKNHFGQNFKRTCLELVLTLFFMV